MSVNNNALRTIDGQNTLFCDTIEINEEIILNGDNGLENYIIKSDGVNARWAQLTSLLTAGTGIQLSGNTISTSNVPNSALENSTISGVSLGSNLNALTKGTNINFSAGTTYDGSSAITISSVDTNTEYTAGSGLSLSGGNEFSLTNNSISGKTLGSNLDNLTAGTNITFSSGSTYNGSTSITINSTDTNTVYTGGEGISISVGNEISVVLQAGTGITIADNGFGNPAISLTTNTISGIPLGNTLGEFRITTGGSAASYTGASNTSINLDNNYTPLVVPTSSTGLPRGALFNNSGVAAFVP